MNLLSIFPYLLLQSRILHMLSETFVSHRMIFFLYAHVVLILFFTEAQLFFLYSGVVIYCAIPPWWSFWLLPNLIMTDSSVVNDLICSFAS